MHCGTTIALHGTLNRHSWLEDRFAEDGFQEHVLDLALSRADAYGWHAPFGWRTPSGRHTFHHPELWLNCESGGDWSTDPGGSEAVEPRELAWLRADISTDPPLPRLPVLPITWTLLNALNRVGTPDLRALCAYLPLQATAGDAEGELEAMRDWFALASPSARHDVRLTVSASPTSATRVGADGERVVAAVQSRLGTAAEVAAVPARKVPKAEEPAHLAGGGRSEDLVRGLRPALRLRFHTREWSPEIAIWLVETVGDALRRTGHTLPVTVTTAPVRSYGAPPTNTR